MGGWGVELGLGRLDAPFGGGVSSGNLKLFNSQRVVYRLVPQKTGTLWDVWVETRARSGPNCSPQLADADAAESSSYSGGNPNNWLWEVRFHPVLANGWFDPSTNLIPAQQFNPYFQRRNSGYQFAADFTYSALRIPLSTGMATTAGTPFAMTILAVNGAPATDYASVNHLYMGVNAQGAQSRNEIVATAKDVFYGLDPRMVLGGSSADGSSQWYPGNNFNGAPFSKHLPTFLLSYSDGTYQGQPYFSAAGGSTTHGTTYTTTFTPSRDGVFQAVRAFLCLADSFPATVAVNGVDKGTVTIAGNPGDVVTSQLPAPVPYAAGDTVTVRFATTVDNSVLRIYANGIFQTLLGQGSSYFASLSGDANRVMPVMPVPWPWPILLSRTAPTGYPSTPTGLTATGGAGFVALAWNANPESFVQSYNIYRGGSLLTTASGTSYTDSAVVAGTPYSYTIQAVAYDSRASGQTGSQSATPSAPASYQSTVQADSPVSYWRLGEASGTTAADVEATNPGTYAATGVTYGTTGLITGDSNTAVTFDASAGSVIVPNSASLQITGAISLEAWINASAALTTKRLICGKVGSNWCYGLETQANGTVEFFIANSSGTVASVTSSAVLSTGTKYHIVGTWDGTTNANGVKIYVNGVSVSATSGIASIRTNTTRFFIGGAATSDTGGITTEKFGGVIDEVAVYNTALSSTRVSAHYSAGA